MKLIELLETFDFWPSLDTAAEIARKHGLEPERLLNTAVSIKFAPQKEIWIGAVSATSRIFDLKLVTGGSTQLTSNGKEGHTAAELGEALEKLKKIFESTATYEVRELKDELRTQDLHPDMENEEDDPERGELQKWHPKADGVLWYYYDIQLAYEVATAADDEWVKISRPPYTLCFRRET